MKPEPPFTPAELFQDRVSLELGRIHEVALLDADVDWHVVLDRLRRVVAEIERVIPAST